jgi:hypothetical protein
MKVVMISFVANLLLAVVFVVMMAIVRVFGGFENDSFIYGILLFIAYLISANYLNKKLPSNRLSSNPNNKGD